MGVQNNTVHSIDTHKYTAVMNTKLVIAVTVLALCVGFSSAQTTTCTASDHATQYAACQTAEALCSSTLVTACLGVQSCIDGLATAYTPAAQLVTDGGVCTCASFTCTAGTSSGAATLAYSVFGVLAFAMA